MMKRREFITLMIVVTLRPAIFDRDTFALDVAGILETLAKCGH